MDQNALKIEAARIALEHVQSGMRLGIGSGTTAEAFIRLLAQKVTAGLDIVGVPTSRRSQDLCMQFGIALTTLDDTPELDLTIDGADEFDPALSLIKGGGGALLREKIVAAASARMIVVADESKQVAQLGRFPLPIEVNPFGLAATRIAVERASSQLGLDGRLELRSKGGKPFITDGAHYILDASFGRIPDPHGLSLRLHAIPGVVEHGLFLGLAEMVVMATSRGVSVITPEPAHSARRSN